jgi:hypothetical protein
VSRRKRSAFRQVQRDLYLTQRTMGDLSALASGRLPRRLARRSATRTIFRLFR